jgi:hypothetical protein
MLGGTGSQEGPVMIADEAVPALSVPDAAQAAADSLDRVRMTQRGYGQARHRMGPAAVTRARTDWGLAVLEWIEASVALAEAEDTRSAPPAGGGSQARLITVETGPVRGRIESSWRQYQQLRRSGGPDQLARARAQWREALVDWFQDLARQRAAEDGQRAAQQRAAADPAAGAVPGSAAALAAASPGSAAPSQAVPGLAAPGSAGPGSAATDPADGETAGTHRPDIAAEQPAPGAGPPLARPPAPRRGQPRYQPMTTGWTPAKRAPGP